MDLLSQVEEFQTVDEYMEDEDITDVLNQVISLIAKPDVGPLKAQILVVKLMALSMKFGILATYYTSFDKNKVNVPKKNMYYTLKEKTKELADALKYVARV